MGKRRYSQHCGIARALDVVGERWTLLIVRDLMLGPLRYSDLLDGLAGITTNLLADRLKAMEALEIVERVRTPPPSVAAYALTERGRDLESVLHALGAWGWQYMGDMKSTDHANPAWGMLALKRRFQPGRHRLSVALKLDGQPFALSIDKDVFKVQRGPTLTADLQIEAAWMQMASVLYGGRSAGAAERDGYLVIAGNRTALSAFVDSFGLQA